MFPGANVAPTQQIQPPPQYPQQGQQQIGQQQINQLPPFMNPMIRSNQSVLIDQQNQSMVNNLSFQSERNPLNQTNTSIYSIPGSASVMNPIYQQQQQQQQQQLAQFQQIPQQQVQVQPVQVKPVQQMPPTTTAPVFKPVPAPNLFNPTQPPPNQPPVPQPQKPQQQLTTPTAANINIIFGPPIPKENKTEPASTAQPFLFGPAIPKKPVETKTEPASATQTQRPFSFAPISTVPATSTPQAPLVFSKLTQQPPAQQTKPPLFQLSPSKPIAETTKSTSAPTTSIFGSNLFKTAETKTYIFNLNSIEAHGFLMHILCLQVKYMHVKKNLDYI